VIEDSEKDSSFLEENKGNLTTDMNNFVKAFMYEGMPENVAQREAVIQVLKDSGIGFYETVDEEKKDYQKAKSYR